jgi:WD40 repeat protein
MSAMGGAGDGGDQAEIARMQAGVRAWVQRAAGGSVRGLHRIPPPALLSMLCASAFSPLITAGAGPSDAVATAGFTVLSSVTGGALSAIIVEALEHARARRGDREHGDDEVERDLADRIAEVIEAGDAHAQRLQQEIATVLKAIDAGGTMLSAAIATGNGQVRRDLIAAVDVLGSGFTQMEFLLRDITRTATEIQENLDEQGATVRVVVEQNNRQSADIRLMREGLAVIERRTRTAATGQEGTITLRWIDGCPYRGLLPFGEADAEVFYGRERMTAELTVQVARGGLLVVTGASGAGKSSLLRAGLLPALARGVQIPGSEHWPRIVMTPTRHPLTELATQLAARSGGNAVDVRDGLAGRPARAHLAVRQAALADAARGRREHEASGCNGCRLVLVVDQFEQVFTLNGGPEGEAERRAFIAALHAAATSPAGPECEPAALVVIAVRGDFWDTCAAYPELADALQDNQFVVGAMTEGDLRLTITGPAEAAGLGIDPALVDTIVGEVGAGRHDMTASLPLLSQAMLLTWENREGTRLTSHGYGRSGGVGHAVQASADAAHDALPGRQQVLARDMLRAMTVATRDGRFAPRPVTRASLYAAHLGTEQAEIDAVLEAFASRRLVVLDADSAQISHDALLSAWPRLRAWLEEDQASWFVYNQLADDAAAWHDSGRDSSFLYRGMRLAVLRQATVSWNADPARFPTVTPVQLAFLEASERGLALISRRRKALASLLVLLLVLSLASAGWAVAAARNANRQRTTAVSGQLAAESETLDSEEPVTAALLAAAAWRLAPTAQARDSMLDLLAQPDYGVLPGGPGSSGLGAALAFNPKTNSLATLTGNGLLRIWSTDTRRQIGEQIDIGPGVDTVAFSPNGKIMVTAGADGVAELWNVANLQAIGTLTAGSSSFTGFGDKNYSAAFSPDGKTVATVTATGSVQLWDVATQARIGAPIASLTGRIVAVAFQPGGKLLATASAGGKVQFWDTSTRNPSGKSLAAGPLSPSGGAGFGLELAFSPSGRILATDNADGRVQFWDTTRRDPIGGISGTLANGEHNLANAIAFSPDGETLATVGPDGTARLWNTASGAAVGVPLAGAAGLESGTAVAFSRDGRILATADDSVRLWRLDIRNQLHLPLTPGRVGSIAFSPDRRTFATAERNGTTQLWNLARNQRIGELPADAHDIRIVAPRLAFSPNGKVLVTFSDLGTPQAVGPAIYESYNSIVKFWDVATQSQIGAPFTTGAEASTAVFSPDSKTLATATIDGTIQLWDTATRRLIWAPAVSENASGTDAAVAFSHDDKILATAVVGDGLVQLWDIATRTQIGTLTVKGDSSGLTRIAFSPDNKTLATWGDPGIVRLWDLATHTQIGAPVATGTGTGQVYDASFSPDGTILATAGADGMARLWDVATHAQIGAPIAAGTRLLVLLAFSPDGKTLATEGDQGTTFWNVALPHNLLESVCAIAGRSLTRDEWDTYVKSEPFQPVCS